MDKYSIKQQIITEKPTLIIEAQTQEELIIKYKQALIETKLKQDTTKINFLITKLDNQEVEIRQIEL